MIEGIGHNSDMVSAFINQCDHLAKHGIPSFRPDETAGHSTKPAKNASKIAGYAPE
ncbi:MAG TPA: hypothetical protein VLS47_09175 [Gallionella sp.]|nr:hypothetical protein [Gallionella sp.]